jgi:hypothetical protein
MGAVNTMAEAGRQAGIAPGAADGCRFRGHLLAVKDEKYA